MVQMAVNDITDQRRAEASMRQLTITDELTGAYNRRHLFYEALLYVESFKSSGTNLSVGVVDIDHFKVVNDTFGHAAGDDALRALTACAHAFLPTVRGCDSVMFARIGGEEFVLLLPGLAEPVAHLDRFRLAVADLTILSDTGPIEIAISIGVSSVRAGDEDFETILGRADAALYDAKHGGRSRVATSP
ncbi:MAG: GGDEF domain-containing protein [Candidatus Devosia euplotis]|nr:GGDEF domain-containing protein [Candidatus Devosia euplotis]